MPSLRDGMAARRCAMSVLARLMPDAGIGGTMVV
jgi:hypothetical protein